jgi:hypothetical protein
MVTTLDKGKTLTVKGGMEEAVLRDLITENKSIPNLFVYRKKIK